MKVDAEIVCHYRTNPLTGDQVLEFEWIGPVHGVAKAGELFLYHKDSLPWPVEAIEVDFYPPQFLIYRTDYPFPWALACNRLQRDSDRFARSWQKFQSRLIYTAQVWGFAYVEQGEMPHWGCIGKKSPWSKSR